jgi:superfamily II DNA/RNA helicase
MEALFNELGLDLRLTEALKLQNITQPTEIQYRVIPLALKNRDVIGQSQTGSGKTLAYLLPIFQRIDAQKREMQTIILAPTHELVMQIEREIKRLASDSAMQITSAAIIGEVNITRQVEKLREKPHIIVGSPGRILELIKRKKLTAHTIKTIVIDEGDRLLDDNNQAVVKDVIKTTLKDRQLMLFSATVSDKILDTARGLMKEPEVIKIQEQNMVNQNINHMYFITEQRDKIEVLRKLIASTKPEKGIIFINKSDEIEITTAKLQYHHINAASIFGSAAKEERKKTMDSFLMGKIQFIVASDIAARGLDVKDVSHIFNLDLPEDPKEYLHRTGRTGRNERPGTAISIVTENEVNSIKKYEKLFNISIPKRIISRGIIK